MVVIKKTDLRLKSHVNSGQSVSARGTCGCELSSLVGAMSLLWLGGAFRSPAEFERLSGLVIRAFGISRAANISYFSNPRKKTKTRDQR